MRYENGQKPSKANANLIRAADDPAFMKGCLERDGELLSAGQREKTEKIVYALISFDGGRGMLWISTRLYEITLQQEVLIEQIAQVMGDVSRLHTAAQKRGDAVSVAVYEDVMRQLALIRPGVTRRENSNELKLSEIRGQIACLKRLAEGREARAA